MVGVSGGECRANTFNGVVERERTNLRSRIEKYPKRTEKFCPNVLGPVFGQLTRLIPNQGVPEDYVGFRVLGT